MADARKRDALETIRKGVHELLALANNTRQDPGIIALLAVVIDAVREALDQMDAEEIDHPGPGESRH